MPVVNSAAFQPTTLLRACVSAVRQHQYPATGWFGGLQQFHALPGAVVSKSALPPSIPHPQVVNSSWALKRLQPLPLEDAERGSFLSQLSAGSSQVRRGVGR